MCHLNVIIIISERANNLPPEQRKAYAEQVNIVSFSFPTINVTRISNMKYTSTVEPLLRGHPDERPLPLERLLDNVNLNINVLIFTPDKRPPLLKGHFSYVKGVALQEGFHCTS